jgi:hypothetical protein
VHGSIRAGDVATTVAVGAAAQSWSGVGEERVEGDVGEEHWPWDLDPVIGTGYRFVGVDDVLGSLDGSRTFQIKRESSTSCGGIGSVCS